MSKITTAERLRKLKIGGIARLITIVIIAVIVLVNVAAKIVLARFPVKLDMTISGFYGIEETTEEYLKSIDTDIKIVVLADRAEFIEGGSYYNQVVECVDAFGRANDKISVSYVDLVDNPSYSGNYPSLSLASGDIIVESAKTKRAIALTATDYFNTNYNSSTYTTTIVSAKTEEALTSAIINTTNEDPKKIAVLSGHGEDDTSAFEDLLKKNGYEVESDIYLYAGTDISGYDGVIICAPTRDYTDDEIEILSDYMMNGKEYGKNLFYFGSTEQGSLPHMDAFLEEWGFNFKSGTVYETDQNKLLYPSPFVSKINYVNTDFTQGLEDISLALTAPQSRPLELVFEEDNGYKTETLAQFTDTAVVMPDDVNTSIWKAEDAEDTGPFPAVALGKIVRYDYTDEAQIKEYSSNIYVFSSSMFVNESVISSTVYANGEYIVNMFDLRFNRNTSVSVVPKYVSSYSMDMSQTQGLVIFVIFGVILPLGLVVTGVVVFLRRRHK